MTLIGVPLLFDNWMVLFLYGMDELASGEGWVVVRLLFRYLLPLSFYA